MNARIDRRRFLEVLGAGTVALAAPRSLRAGTPRRPAPNIILCMSDDQGWGDTGYYGHPVLKTPNLDAMASEGIRFDRWYAGSPVCSPTRGSCLTGRHPYRYGIFSANVGHMPAEEITLAEALKTRGYVTGHFGKWHLGTLTKTIRDGRRGGPRGAAHYAPPWTNGFDVCFSTEQAIPTWDPMKDQPIPTKYWIGEGKWATENLEGDDSRVIMDRAIPFIEGAVAKHRPFLAVIWFHSPHERVRAGGKYVAMYAGEEEKRRDYFACLTAMDEQVGRLRRKLRALGVERNTLLCFTSDNGPEHRKGPGSAGPFRGRKRSLYEGGVRVPGILVWPDRIPRARIVKTPCSTLDYYPTILDILGLRMKGQPQPLDGISLLPLLEGRMAERPRPIPFESGRQVALTDNRYKLYSANGGRSYALYDLIEDPGEKEDLADAKQAIAERMRATLAAWRASCARSRAGADDGRA